jgi:hypothetical protein
MILVSLCEHTILHPDVQMGKPRQRAAVSDELRSLNKTGVGSALPVPTPGLLVRDQTAASSPVILVFTM